MNVATMTREQLQEIDRRPADFRNREEYDLKLEVARQLDIRFGTEIKADTEAREAEETTRKREEKREKRRETVNGLPTVDLPRWWFTSGTIATLRPSAAIVAVAVAVRINPEQNHECITYHQLGVDAGVSPDTAKRGVRDACKAGLIRKHTRAVKNSNPPRRSCFYSLDFTGGHPCPI